MKTKKQLLEINKFLSKPSIIAFLICFLDIFLFGLLNFFVNGIIALPEIISGEKSMTLNFFLPNLSKISNSKVLLYLYLFFGIIVVIFDITTIFRIRMSYSQKYINIGQKGSRRPATDEEIKQQYKRVDLRETRYSGLPGTIIARRGNDLYIDDSAVNNLYIGMTRSGKDETVCAPNDEVYSRAEIQPSIIQFDPKSEGYKYGKKELENRNYQVYLLNLIDPLHSMGFNLLTEAIDLYKKRDFGNFELMIQSIAYSLYNPGNSIGDNKFFDSNAVHLLSALCIAFTEDNLKADEKLNEKRFEIYQNKVNKFIQLSKEDQQAYREKFEVQKNRTSDFIIDNQILYIPNETPFFNSNKNEKKINIYSIITTSLELANIPIPNSYNTMLDEFFLKRPIGDRAKLKYSAINLAGDKAKGSIYSTMLDKLMSFTYENVAKMTMESSFKLEEIGFGEKPIAVFINAPDYDESLHILASIFVNQVYVVNARKAGDAGSCKRPIKFVANEIGNFPAITGLKSMVTVGLARKISFDFHIQDLSQLEKVYGKDAKSIIDNCGNKFYILSDDEDTNKFFSNLIGSETFIDVQRTGHQFSLKKSFLESPNDKPLMKPEALALLKPGENILVRTIKRTDLKGNPIEAMPIFNLYENGNQMYYRYEYLDDIFPSPQNIALSELNTESREHIKLTDYLMTDIISSSCDDSFCSYPVTENFQQKRKSNFFMPNHNLTWGEIPEQTTISIETLLNEKLGEDYEEILQITSETTLYDLMKAISENNTLSDMEKNAITFVLSNYIEEVKM